MPDTSASYTSATLTAELQETRKALARLSTACDAYFAMCHDWPQRPLAERLFRELVDALHAAQARLR